jgi:hypothetical protein
MPTSEYDPLFAAPDPESPAEDDDLAPVRARFAAASRSFLRSPWPWVAWAVVLPAVALATPTVARLGGPAGVLLAWSGAILLGGAVEGGTILRGARRGRRPARTPLSGWALSLQGNLSLVALALSVFLLWQDLPQALPGLWLLLLGHSFYALGGLSFPPMRTAGLLFQAGGAAALWPGWDPLLLFAAAAAAGNLWLGFGVWRAGRGGG